MAGRTLRGVRWTVMASYPSTRNTDFGVRVVQLVQHAQPYAAVREYLDIERPIPFHRTRSLRRHRAHHVATGLRALAAVAAFDTRSDGVPVCPITSSDTSGGVAVALAHGGVRRVRPAHSFVGDLGEERSRSCWPHYESDRSRVPLGNYRCALLPLGGAASQCRSRGSLSHRT